MGERNLCHQSGCPDLCCRDKYIFSNGNPAMSNKEIKENFGTSNVVSGDIDTRALDREGLFQIGKSQTIYFVKGKCQQNVDGCISPLKPRGCLEGIAFAGDECNRIRKTAGLPQVSKVNKKGEIEYKKGLLFRLFSIR